MHTLLLGATLRTLGHNKTRPFLGSTVRFKPGKLVPPPSSTSFKYIKAVKIRTPTFLSLCVGI